MQQISSRDDGENLTFAGLWEEIAAPGENSEAEQARLYQELLGWTERGLK